MGRTGARRCATAAAVTAAAVAVSVLAARTVLRLINVEGASMEPGLVEGDRLLCLRLPDPLRRGRTVGDLLGRSGLLRSGSLVVARGPFGPFADPDRPPVLAVKRLAALPGEPLPDGVDAAPGGGRDGRVPPGHLVLLGDNAENSEDSRDWGPVPQDRLYAVPLRVLPVRRGRQSARTAAGGRSGQ